MGQAINNSVKRFFTQPKTKGYDALTWVKRDALLIETTNRRLLRARQQRAANHHQTRCNDLHLSHLLQELLCFLCLFVATLFRGLSRT